MTVSSNSSADAARSLGRLADRAILLLGVALCGLTLVRAILDPAGFAATDGLLGLAGIAFAAVGWKQACQRQLIKLDGPRRLRHFALISSGVLVTLFLSLNQLGSGTRWYRRTLDEGSLVEWITCLAFLLSAWLLWRAAGSFDGRLQRLVLRAMGVACFVIAMEEISWGQMVFNWQSPDWFMGSNSQQETSLHNIKGINSSVDVAFLIGLLGLTVGSVLTHLSHRRQPARSGAWGDILFPPTYLLGFFLPSLAIVACVVADASFGIRILLPGEIEVAELLTSVGLTLQACRLYLHWNQAQTLIAEPQSQNTASSMVEVTSP